MRIEYMCVCVIYVTNHDQTAMILLGGLLLYLLYCIYKKNKKSIIASTLKLLVFSVACYVVMFLIPGHLYRMHDASEMEFWFPQYASWSFSKKLYHGFSTTVANLFFSDVKIFILFALIIFLLGVSQKTWLKTIIASIPLTLIVSSRLVGTDKFVVYYEYSCGMPDLLPLTVTVMPFLISIVAVVSIFYTVYSCVDEEKNKWTILLFLFLAAGSREMMGLSATIYASSFRTFTAFLYLIMMACLVLLGELNRNSNCALWFSAVGAIPIMLVLQLLQ